MAKQEQDTPKTDKTELKPGTSNTNARQEQAGRVAKSGAVRGLYLIIVLAIVVVLNLVMNMVSIRLDLTRDQRYTLADSSRNLVNELPAEMTVYAFISADLPAQYSTIERSVNDLLADYRQQSNGNFDYRIIDPADDVDGDTDGTTEDVDEANTPTDTPGQVLAAEYGVNPITIVDESSNQISFREVYVGVAIVYQGEDGETVEVVEQLFPGMNLEYEMTRRMRALIYGENIPVLGIVINDGSFLDLIVDQATVQQSPMAPVPDRQAVLDELCLQLGEQLFDELFTVTLVDLEEELSDDLEGLIVLGPTETYSDIALQHLDAFVMSGRGVAFFVSPYKLEALDLGDMQMPNAQAIRLPADNVTGLDALLGEYGVEIHRDTIIDAEAAQLSVAMQIVGYMGEMPVQQPVPITDPRLPLASQINTESIVAANIPFLAFMPGDRNQPLPISTLGLTEAGAAAAEDSLQVTEVASTSPVSIRLQDRMEISLEDASDPELEGEVGSFPVIMTLEGPMTSAFDGGSTESGRILVASNGEFVSNVFNNQDPLRDPRLRRSLPPAVAQSIDAYMMSTVMFIQNTADWLVQDADLIAIRSRGMPAFVDPDALRPGRRRSAQWINIAGIPFVFLGIGALVFVRRKSRRAALQARFAAKDDAAKDDKLAAKDPATAR